MKAPLGCRSACGCACLLQAKAARPRCRWGYYGLPCAFSEPCTNSSDDSPLCGYDHPTAGPALRAQAAQQQPIVDVSDSLYPSLYPQSIAPAGDTPEQYRCMDAGLRGPHCRIVSLGMWRATVPVPTEARVGRLLDRVMQDVIQEHTHRAGALHGRSGSALGARRASAEHPRTCRAVLLAVRYIPPPRCIVTLALPYFYT